MNNPILHVRIISPKHLILDTPAISVSSKNTQGKFDILPYHANFITIVENEAILIRTTSKSTDKITIQLPIAIIFVANNTVNIYTYAQFQTTKPHML